MIRAYVREFGLVVVLGVLTWAGNWLYVAGGKQERLDCAQTENARLKAAQAQIERWQKIANDTDDKLQKALAAPKAAPKIREVIHANPSHCVVPPAVSDGLRDAIRAGNKAISG